MVMRTPRLTIRPGNPDFLDLPWDLAIDDWTDGRLVTMPVGVHRHPVVFVEYEEDVYAIKEMPTRLASNEFDVLRDLETVIGRSAKPAGLVTRTWLDPHQEQASAVITHYVKYAFPYRHLLIGSSFGPRRSQMLDAFAGLLVDLHLAGCYWGDCSLSNVLYRYDAGAIEAIMIDAETSELHQTLSDGQRLQDIEIMKENLAGEMSDIAAMREGDTEFADLGLGEDIASRYDTLWTELNAELVISRDEGYRVRERISRLNELGFSVHDVGLEPTESGDLVTMEVHVGGRTFNSDRLKEMTGIEASENQAGIILGDLNYFMAKRGITSTTGKRVAGYQWFTESFEPVMERISRDWPGEDPLQGYCDFLNHRFELATERGADVQNDVSYESWASSGFPGFSVGD
jgi:Domain of unknown function (DUF4032)/Lipopolysaccharide kinase (Kdo/WaaP) family